jgi:hypothetical protein
LDCNAGGSDAVGLVCWIVMQVVLMQVVWFVGLRCRGFGSLDCDAGGLGRWIAMQVVLMQVVWFVGL